MKDIKPYKDSTLEKKAQVEQMFDNISARYDLLNRVLSLGIDVTWRKKALKMLVPYTPYRLLDLATGTGDVAILANSIIKPLQVTGADLSEGMLAVARKKIADKGFTNIEFVKCDSESLPFQSNNFDAAIVAFGVRNFENTLKGLEEINRVLKHGQPLVVLEFSKPTTFPVKQLYFFYFKYILPLIGRLVSKDQSAYTYLPESVNAFPEGSKFLELLKQAGFKNVRLKKLTAGIATIYLGEKN